MRNARLDLRSSFPLLLLVFCGCHPERGQRGADLADLFARVDGQGDSRQPDEELRGWTAAVEPRDFAFPADHGAHEDYRIEWWYYTGNLEAADGRRFGYQLTFFRTGLHPNPRNPSRWAVRDLYTAHFAVSDLGAARHFGFQRSNRRGIDLAGVATGSYHVWNQDWQARLEGERHRLRAAQAGIAIDLTLSPQKPPVLHGDAGLSQKGASPGNASHYYSLTRMATEGTVQVAGETFSVDGDSWMDHEFSTSFLEPGQRGWDWFAIQFDDGRELMLYRMRLDDGSADPYSSGTFVDKSGRATPLSSRDYTLTPGTTWQSPDTGAQYPLHWSIQVPRLGLDLVIRPAFPDQEMETSQTTGISYWEGAIDITGHEADRRVGGRGYLELTGYAGTGLGSLLDN
jgi:predicted secreted hydrolase